MTTSKRIEWDWRDDGSSATADLSEGFAAILHVSPDEFGVDVDDSVFTEAEINDMFASELHVEMFHDGALVWDGYLGGVITSMSESYLAAQAYAEDCAQDMLADAPKPCELAGLLLGVVR
jgi:hypothetical protein